MNPSLFNRPLLLDHAGAWRVYLGGSRLRALRGQSGTADDHFPEEWIASTTEATGAGATPGAGLSRLADAPELTLRQCIQRHPDALLGSAFTAKYGTNPGVLLKLLDASERLNVQIHPDRPTAKTYFHSDFGKAECWHFLPGRTINGQEPQVYLGLKAHVTPALWRAVFERGDSQEILDCMHSFPAIPGQTVLIDGGVPHAIGAGCFLLEIQEPTDFTLRMERRTRSGTVLSDEICHMGMGYDAMFASIRYDHFSREQTRDAWFIPPAVLEDSAALRLTRLLGYDRCPYFSMERLDIRDACFLEAMPVFCGLLVLKGDGTLAWEGGTMTVSQGDELFLPAKTAIQWTPNAGQELCVIRFFGPQV